MFSIGLDIGGTKIAGAIFNPMGEEQSQFVRATPSTYRELVETCIALVFQLEKVVGARATVGVGVPGSIDRETGVPTFAANTPCLVGQPLRDDLIKGLSRPVTLANDADCAALSETTDGAGMGHKNVFGLILGTGVGGGLVVNGNLIQGLNGLSGEFGHLALPFRESSDGPLEPCHCGQNGCIDKSASGPALARLYEHVTHKMADAEKIAALAHTGDVEASAVLDTFLTIIAKATIPIIYMFDPDIIVVSGGLRDLPHIYDEVPKRWSRYTLHKDLKTRLVPAKHGSLSGLRGAAWVGRN